MGYGHLLDTPGTEIDDVTAEALLDQDIERVESRLRHLVSIQLTDEQWDAVVSFVFNLGAGAFQRSTLRRIINRGDHDAVPAELLKWVWAGGNKLKKKFAGLVKRRTLEGHMYAGYLDTTGI